MIGDYRVDHGQHRRRQSRRIRLSRAARDLVQLAQLERFRVQRMYGPGQNRASSKTSNSNLASAEQDCAGGNIPGSGALPPACNDGSFGNLYSVTVTYT